MSATEHQYLWPLGRIRHDERQTRNRLFPLFWYTKRYNELGSQETDWYFLFPFFWGGSRPDDGENYFAFFDDQRVPPDLSELQLHTKAARAALAACEQEAAAVRTTIRGRLESACDVMVLPGFYGWGWMTPRPATETDGLQSRNVKTGTCWMPIHERSFASLTKWGLL